MQLGFLMLMPPVSRYMTANPCAVAPRDRLSSAHELMTMHKIRHLPVLDGEKLVGIVSDHDLLGIHVPDDHVADAMSCDVAAFPEGAPLDEVIELMEVKRFSSVVIVGKAGVKGIFTLTDAMRAFCDLLHRAEESA